MDNISNLQGILESVVSKIQSLQITATYGNVTVISETISELQRVYNALATMRNGQGGDENGREIDIS